MQYAGVPPISTDPDCSNLGFIGHKVVTLAALSYPCALIKGLLLMVCRCFNSHAAAFS